MKKLFVLAVLAAAAAAVVVVILNLRRREQPLPLPAQEKLEEVDLHTLDESELGGSVSPELLKILVCPEDKGPLTLASDGKWLINPRNGYRYPIRRGIPVMLIEEGRKYRDASLAQAPDSAAIS